MDEIKPPTFLNAATKKKYIQVAEMLMEDGNWKDGDDIALSALFANYQRWVQAEQAIKKNKSLTFTTDTNYSQQIPEISIANNAMKSMLSFIKEFGLSPKERQKLKGVVMGDGSNGVDDEMDNMIVK